MPITTQQELTELRELSGWFKANGKEKLFRIGLNLADAVEDDRKMMRARGEQDELTPSIKDSLQKRLDQFRELKAKLIPELERAHAKATREASELAKQASDSKRKARLEYLKVYAKAYREKEKEKKRVKTDDELYEEAVEEVEWVIEEAEAILEEATKNGRRIDAKEAREEAQKRWNEIG